MRDNINENIEALEGIDDRTLLVMLYTDVQNFKSDCIDCRNRVRDLDNRLWGALLLAIGAVVTAMMSFLLEK